MIDLKKVLAVGQNAVVRKVVQKSDTAGNFNVALNGLLATPACIEMIINAAVETVDRYLPEGYISVGSAIQFSHTAPTSLGMTVNVKTTIDAIEDHHVSLAITAWDEMGEIGHGTYERVVVSRDATLKRAKDRTHFLVRRSL
ncbi:Fluoroacetyl-CoA thioesterase [bioreactor metagenome]|uniref:Fluoroacetyl-CoA thioesterase n=1 Tax=bioreactor metagenome TaxID=1076179 RepID=A0A644UDQ7_9ZZZZ